LVVTPNPEDRQTGLVFLSGGSALNPMAARMAESRLQATHVISAFDNGGSSRWLREAFHCIAIGDVRNRLTAISRPGRSANKHVLDLFKTRLPEDKPQALLRQKVDAIARGSSDLLNGISAQHKGEIQAALGALLTRVPEKFDWRNGSIGNFLLVGKYIIENEKWTAALQWAHDVLRCVGNVFPVTITSAHLGAELRNGRVVVGQKTLTDQHPPIEQPVKELRLLKTDRNFADRVRAEPYQPSLDAIMSAKAIVYSWGSFYTSVLPAFLVAGLPEAIVSRDVPRVLLLNPLRDSETIGMSPADVVGMLEKYAARGREPSTRRAVTHVVALRPRTPSRNSFYDERALGLIAASGVDVTTIECEDLPEEPEIETIIELLLKLAGRS
jgi:CofD-related protein of GAK system